MAEIRNPNQPGGGGQDSRTLLIFSVVFVLIFLGLQYFSPKKKPQPETPAEVASTAPARTSVTTPTTAAPDSAKTATPAVVATNESTTVVENELYRITFSNRGGQAISWILKKYKDDAGKPLDLVNQKAAAKLGYPLSLWTYDANLRTQLAQALYVPSATGTLNAPGSLTFTYSEQRAGGEEDIHLRFDLRRTRGSDDDRSWEPGHGPGVLAQRIRRSGDAARLCRLAVRHHAGW